MEEKEIIEKILKGQSRYFEWIIEKYQKLIFKIFYQSNYFKNSHDIEDLVQETFLTVFEKLSSYKTEYEFRNWIYTIALNKLRGFIKKEKVKNKFKKILFMNYDEEDVRFKEEESIEQKEFLSKMKTAIQKLPENFQKALILYYTEELKMKDIAEILKTNENTIKTWIRRGKEMLEDNQEIKKFIKN